VRPQKRDSTGRIDEAWGVDAVARLPLMLIDDRRRELVEPRFVRRRLVPFRLAVDE
jgi:hypothetical protein